MTIEVSKQTIGAEDAILWEFHEEWQWTDFLTAVDSSNELLDDAPQDICLILNIRYDIPEDHLAMANIRHAVKRFEGCDIIFVLEGAEMSSQIAVNVFKEEYPELSEKVYIVHTLDDAYLYVDPFYTRPRQ